MQPLLTTFPQRLDVLLPHKLEVEHYPVDRWCVSVQQPRLAPMCKAAGEAVNEILLFHNPVQVHVLHLLGVHPIAPEEATVRLPGVHRVRDDEIINRLAHPKT